MDISDPVNPVRLDAVADSNFSYWHSATFNNDGTKMLFSDEWGGGGGPKCRAGDKPQWGADAIFTIENKKLKFQSYYKIPTYQTANENWYLRNVGFLDLADRVAMRLGGGTPDEIAAAETYGATQIMSAYNQAADKEAFCRGFLEQVDSEALDIDKQLPAALEKAQAIAAQ
jgi:hypothetical protein